MDTQFVYNSEFQRLIIATSWTLIHSVWQGMLLAMVTGIVLLTTSKARSTTRYNLFSFLLFLFICAIAATFWIEISNQYSNVESVLTSSNTLLNTTHRERALAISNPVSDQLFWQLKGLIIFLSQNTSSIFAIWLAVFAFKSIKMLTGIHHLQNVRTSGTIVVDRFWLHRLEQLTEKLKIKKAVLLAESERVTTPMVQGIFRPMIILPIGLLSNIPYDQVEAILLHELAHIKRTDYGINLLQSFVENAFFFNPAILWLSGLIREEREYCCDDLAISFMKSGKTFVDALVSFQEYRNLNNPQTIPFTGKTNHLLIRVKRLILNNYNKPLNAMEKIFVTVCLIVTIATTVAFSTVKPAKKVELERTSTSQAKKDNSVISMSYVPLRSDTNMTAAKKISATDSLFRLKKLSMETLEAQKQVKDLRDEILKLWQESYKRWDIITDSRKQKTESKLRSEAFQHPATPGRDNQDLASNLDHDQKQHQMNAALLKMRAEVLRVDSLLVKAKVDKAELLNDDFDKESKKKYRLELAARNSYTKKLQTELIDDLVETGIAKNKENLSFKLHNKFLIVNGKAQPDQIHEAFRAKYLEDDWHEWVYNFDGKTGYAVNFVRFPF